MKALRLLSMFVMFFILIVWLYSDSGVADTRDIAVVLKVKGNAELRKNKTRAWNELRKATRLRAGDKVRTGSGSLVAMVFTDDKSMLKIRSDSEIAIGGQRTKKGFSKRLFMGLGQMWAKVNPRGGGFRMETPSGVAAVKGTEFYGLVYADSLVILGVSGWTELFHELGSVTVGKDQKGKIAKGIAPILEEYKNRDTWADEGKGEEQILEVEFEDEHGDKKTLRIRYREK